MDILIKASQLLLSLSILVILHELGHFIPAKLFKTRVEKFYLFFDPWFSLFKIKRAGTEYGIGWLPLGGYVKIAGMIDESMDKEQMNKPPEPWEFRSKPAWQRLIIMIGGVTVNLLLGWFIYSMTLFAYGEKRLPIASMKDGIWVEDSLALNMGFRSGDKILQINDKNLTYFEDIMPEMLYAKTVLIERDGEKKTLAIPQNFLSLLIDNKRKVLFYPRIPAIVSHVPDTSPAKAAGLKSKDRIIAINGRPTLWFDQLRDSLRNYRNEKVLLTVVGETGERSLTMPVTDEGKLGYENVDVTSSKNRLGLNVQVAVDSSGKIGFVPALLDFTELERLGIYKFHSVKYGFLQSFPAGLEKAKDRLSFYVKQFALILNPSTGAYKGLGGFGSLGGMFPAEWNWEAFWNITAFLSLILAFMNILPIPALDGGHVMFLLYEVISGRKPGEKFMEYAQYAGMLLLFSLLIFANLNDVLRLFK